MGTDLAARIAETAEFIEARLDDDEETAQDMARGWPAPWSVDHCWVNDANGQTVVYDEYHWRAVGYIARHDPGRALRRVRATRDMVAAVLAEQHEYVIGDEFYSCSQSRGGLDIGEPGSGCSNPERAGKPCDCGRDARVARLLGIIASEWREEP